MTAPRLWTRPFLLLVATQACFGFAWSTFLLVPKLLAGELHADPTEVGIAATVTGLAGMLVVPIAGRSIDAIGPRRFVTWGSVGLLAAAAGYTLVDRVGPTVWLLQALHGAGFVFAFNGASVIAVRLVVPERLTEGMGFLGAANMVMNAIAPGTGEVLAQSIGWEPVFGAAAVAAVAAILASHTLPADPPAPPIVPWRGALRGIAPLVPLYGGMLLLGFGLTSMFVFHAPWALDAGVEDVRPFFLGYTATALLVRIAGGRFFDRIGPKRVARVAFVGYGLAPILAPLLGPTHLATLGALLGVFHGALFPALFAMAALRAPVDGRGLALAFLHGAFQGGATVAGVTLGALAESFGYPAAFVTAGLLCVLGAFLVR